MPGQLDNIPTLSRQELEDLSARFGIENPYDKGDEELRGYLTDKANDYRALRQQIASLDDSVVEFALEDGVLVEVGGDGRWDADSGIGIDGTTQQLDHLPGFTSFPADYTTFFPDGSFWQESGIRTVEDILSS